MRAPLLALATLAALLLPGFAAAETGNLTLTGLDRADVLTMDLKANEAVDYSWSATGSVEFTVKRVSDGVEVFRQTGQLGRGTVTVPADGSYVFRFRNTQFSPVILEWTLNRQTSGLWILLGLFLVVLVIIILGLWQRSRRTAMHRPPQIPLQPR